MNNETTPSSNTEFNFRLKECMDEKGCNLYVAFKEVCEEVEKKTKIIVQESEGMVQYNCLKK